MLEALLITACLYGTQDSCISSGQAYYKYSGLEKQVENFSNGVKEENPLLYNVGSYSLIFYMAKTKKQLTIPMGKFYTQYSLTDTSSINGYLVGYRIGF